MLPISAHNIDLPELSAGLAPPYPPLLANPTRTRPALAPTDSIDEFLTELATRMGYLLPGGIPDTQRAAMWFVEWWRNSAAENTDLGGTPNWGWGLDCQWDYDPHTQKDIDVSAPVLAAEEVAGSTKLERLSDPSKIPLEEVKEDQDLEKLDFSSLTLEERFDHTIARHLRLAACIDDTSSDAQIRKRTREENKQRREQRRLEVAQKRTDALRRSKR